MKTKKLLFIGLMFGLSTSLSAQSIRGSVVDADKQPLEWASISLLSTADSTLLTGTMTDSLGNFELKELTEGPVVVRIDYVGFSAQEKLVEITGDKDLGQVSLGADVTLKEITVVATKPKIAYRDGKLIFDISEVESIGSSGLELLKTVPLIKVDKDENLLVRGSNTKVLINGKDLNLRGQELTAYLNALSSDDIVKVEVITNPSSKYEAGGSGGIINVILKEKKPGYYSSLYSKVSYGDRPNYYMGANVSYFKNKFGISASVDPGFIESPSRLTIDRKNTTEGYESEFHQVNQSTAKTKRISGNLALNYEINPRSSLSTFFKGSFSGSEDNTINNTQIIGLESDSLSLKKDDLSNWNTYTTGVNYQVDIDSTGKNLSAEYMLIKAGNHTENQQTTQFFNGGILEPNPFDLADRTDYNYLIHSAKLDYYHPFAKKLNLEAGLKYSNIDSKSDLQYDIATEDEEYILIPLVSNTFDYTESNYAAYANAEKSIGKWNLRAGLRMEYTKLKTTLDSDQSLMNKDEYLEFFPSTGINFAPKEGHNISLSYSRRLTRPYYKDLNPSISFLGQYSYSQGNPALRPEFSNILELGYQIKSTVFSAYAMYNQGTVGEVLLQNDANSVIITTEKNLNSSKYFGLDFNTYFTLFKKVDGSIYLSGGYNENAFEEGNLIVKQHVITGYGYLDFKYRFLEDFTVDISGSYTSPSQRGLYKLAQAYSVNAGASYSKNNFSLSLRWKDIFRTNRWDSEIDYNNVEAHWVNKWETGIVSLALRYKFGNREASKKGRYKKSTRSEESDRINK